jgi:hypothetical protein
LVAAAIDLDAALNAAGRQDFHLPIGVMGLTTQGEVAGW